ncbi:MAG TPA: NUDIX domain-containing protein [Devosiaceae bacterium]|jgi:8-oxo-dGTP pyrophosphatase MutT (NUDIX family)
MKFTLRQRLVTASYLFLVGIKRRMTLGARVILIDGDKVFLIRHTYLPGWQFPGGGVEPGETAEHSGAREVMEETGLRVTGPMELFGLYHNTNPATNRDHVAVYLCRSFEKAKDFHKSYEIADGQWFAVDALPDDLTPATAKRLAEVFRGVPRDAVWGIV